MKTRKLILIIADVVLLAVCITQFVLGAHDTTKYFNLKDSPDMVVIDTPDEKGITVQLENDSWYVGKDKFPAKQSIVTDLINSVETIRVIDKVGSTANEAALDRYELNDIKKTVVTFYKDGNVVRTLNIGKEAMASSQCYITIDDGKDIYLATGDLAYTYDVKESDIRSETVMKLDVNEITEVSISKADGSAWSISRMGSGDDMVWNISGAEVDVDGSKATTWFGAVSIMNTMGWYESSENPEGEKIMTVKIVHAYKTTTLDLYALPAQEGVPQAYFGRSSDVPFAFAVNSDYIESFNKNPEELAK